MERMKALERMNGEDEGDGDDEGNEEIEGVAQSLCKHEKEKKWSELTS